jgi:hypothetical protein
MGELRQIHPELITVFSLAESSGHAYAMARYQALCPAQLRRVLKEELSAVPVTIRDRGWLAGQRAAVQELIDGKSPENPARTGEEGN